MDIRFAEDIQIVNLRSPAATTDDVESTWVKLGHVQWLSFLMVGVL